MADQYVSQDTSNGYGLGNDTTGNGTKALPWFTIERAITAATTGGDTIYINDGTYDDATNYQNINKANLIFEPENDYLAILRSVGSGQTRTVNVATTGVTFGKIVIDANSVDSQCVTFNAGSSDITFSGTKFIGATATVFGNTAPVANLTLTNDWIIDCSDFTANGISLEPSAAGTITIENGTITTSNLVTGSTNKILIFATALVAATHLIVRNITFNVTDGDNNGTTLVKCSGFATTDIHDNTLNGTGVVRLGGYVVNNHATLTSTKCSIYNNTGAATLSGTAVGHLVIVGDEATGAGDDSISNINVYNNSLGNADHGILIGFCTGARVEGNTITDVVLGLVAKEDTGSRFGGNTVSRCTGAVLYAKGAVNSVFGNNTVILSSGFASEALYTGDNVAVNSTGIVYKNNNIYTDVEPTRVTYADTANTATYENNNFYYTDGALTSNDFQYQGTSYASLALWETGVATASNNTEVEPLMTDVANGDYSLTQSSPLVGTGTKWWTGANPTGIDGEPFSDFDTDVGGSQSIYGSFHPVRLG